MITRSEWQAQNREQLRRLDDCLTVLEEAHEIDLIYVTEAMAELLKTRIPAITPGMRIADAIEEVLRMQEPYMLKPPPPPVERRRHPSQRHHSYDISTIIGSAGDGASGDMDRLTFFPKRSRGHR